jgi:putative CocE/NonD family hydrolase
LIAALSGCGDGSSDAGGVGGTGASGGGGSDGAGGEGGATPELPDGVVDVVMRDGVTLKTRIHLPSGDGPFPLFVVRNPYAWLNGEELEAYAQFFQDRGIGLVWQAVRGTGESEGEFVPYVSEVADAADTLAWLGDQPWSNGRFATGGGSYLGYTAWAAAAADPRVRAVISDDTAADEEMTRHGGVVDGYLLSWWSFVERERFANDAELDALTNALDLPNVDEAVLGRDLPYWNDLLDAGLATYPPEAALRTLAKDLCVPALHVLEGSTGWRDPIQTWRAIEADGCAEERDHQWLVVAPESHSAHFSAFGVADTWVTDDMMTMLSAFLLEAEPPPTWARVRYRTASDGQTQSTDAWPPPTALPLTVYLGAPAAGEGTLSTAPPAADVWTLVSDPAGTNPCALPTDVWFTSEPLTEDLHLVGEPQLHLPVTTDATDFDVLVTLYDYAPSSGDYAVLGTGSVRARYRTGREATVPAGVPFDLDLDLTGGAQLVPAGHQLTLALAPSRCGFGENPNSGEPIQAQTTRQVASVDVELGPSGARLEVPRAE